MSMKIIDVLHYTSFWFFFAFVFQSQNKVVLFSLFQNRILRLLIMSQWPRYLFYIKDLYKVWQYFRIDLTFMSKNRFYDMLYSKLKIFINDKKLQKILCFTIWNTNTLNVHAVQLRFRHSILHPKMNSCIITYLKNRKTKVVIMKSQHVRKANFLKN